MIGSWCNVFKWRLEYDPIIEEITFSCLCNEDIISFKLSSTDSSNSFMEFVPGNCFDTKMLRVKLTCNQQLQVTEKKNSQERTQKRERRKIEEGQRINIKGEKKEWRMETENFVYFHQ